MCVGMQEDFSSNRPCLAGAPAHGSHQKAETQKNLGTSASATGSGTLVTLVHGKWRDPLMDPLSASFCCSASYRAEC